MLGALFRRETWKSLCVLSVSTHVPVFQDREPRGIIPLENLGVREFSDSKRPHCLEIFSDASSAIKACKTDSEGKVVEGETLVLIEHWTIMDGHVHRALICHARIYSDALYQVFTL